MLRIFPGLDIFKWYKRRDFPRDLIAGLTVGIMLVPQSMAYAMLAGLPPVYGLYASTIPLLIYPLFGSSRQVVVGPVAMVSLLIYVNCSKYAEPGTIEYIHLAIALAFVTGLIQLTLGILKTGFIANYFSRAVVSGFTAAAVLIIFASQIKNILGIQIETSTSFTEIILNLIKNIGDTNPATMILGLTGFLVIFLIKRRFKRFPAALLAVILGTAAVHFLQLDKLGVQTVMSVPKGLPNMAMPSITLTSFSELIVTGLLITFISYMESISVSQVIADRLNYKVDPNRELKGLGMANLVGSFFSAIPVTGGFSRTAVNYQSGAKSGIASVVTAIIVILTLLFLTPYFNQLPIAILSSFIMVAVLTLIDINEIILLFRIKTLDGIILVITFLGTLIFGILEGLSAGILFSLAVFIWRSSHPNTAELGYVDDLQVFRNVRRFPQARTFKNTVLFRVDSSLFFANMAFVEEQIRHATLNRDDIHWVVMDLSGVNDIDAVSILALDKIMKAYMERGIRFAFSGMKGPVRDLVRKAGWHEKYGELGEYLTIRHALHELGLWSKEE